MFCVHILLVPFRHNHPQIHESFNQLIYTLFITKCILCSAHKRSYCLVTKSTLSLVFPLKTIFFFLLSRLHETLLKLELIGICRLVYLSPHTALDRCSGFSFQQKGFFLSIHILYFCFYDVSCSYCVICCTPMSAHPRAAVDSRKRYVCVCSSLCSRRALEIIKY